MTTAVELPGGDVSILDEWVSGFNAALTTVGTALGTGIGAYFLGRRQFSKLSKDIAEDRAEVKRAGMEIGWLERLVKEREELLGRIESLRESQLNDTRALARSEAECKACHERVSEARVDLAEAEERLLEANRLRSAAEERVILFTGELLNLKLANGRLYTELVKLDAGVAERFLVHHLKVPPPPNDAEDQT